jgi:hypothetical protein
MTYNLLNRILLKFSIMTHEEVGLKNVNGKVGYWRKKWLRRIRQKLLNLMKGFIV